MNFHSRVSDMIITHYIITNGIAGLKKFIRDNRLTMCEDRIKALLAIPEVVGII